MKLLADEGVDRPIVDQLRQDGHQVFYVAEVDPSQHERIWPPSSLMATMSEAALATR